MMIDKRYQRTRENKEIVCNSEWLLTKQEMIVEPWEKCDEWLISKINTGKKRSPYIPINRKPSLVYCSYNISYKLWVLSYWGMASIPSGPTKWRKPTRTEVINRFRIPGSNLTWWRKVEAGGKYIDLWKGQQQASGGRRKRQWKEMERQLYDRFRVCRATGEFVRRG